MSTWFNSDSMSLIGHWRSFRKELESVTDKKEILDKVANFWGDLPRGARSIDYYTPSSWPTPWEILHDRLYCDNSVTLMMYYTLALLPQMDNEEIEIYLIDDSSEEFLILVVGEDDLLNYDYRKVCSFKLKKKTFKMCQKVKKQEIPTIK